MARGFHSDAQQRLTASSRRVAPDVEVGVLLAGEGHVGQVLGRGRRANGDRHVVTERPVGLADLLGDRGGHVLAGEQRLRRVPDRRGSIPSRKPATNAPVGLGGDVEPGGDRQPGRGQPGQRRALAAHTREVSGRVVERQHHLHGVLPVAGRHLPIPMGLLPLARPRTQAAPSSGCSPPA